MHRVESSLYWRTSGRGVLSPGNGQRRWIAILSLSLQSILMQGVAVCSQSVESATATRGVFVEPLSPAAVDDNGRSLYAETPALLEIVNRSRSAVDIYWINYSGQRVLYPPRLAAGATCTMSTFLTHPWLVVRAGTGSTARDSGLRLAGFEPVTANPTRNPALRDVAVVQDANAWVSPEPVHSRAEDGAGSLIAWYQLSADGADTTKNSPAFFLANTSFRDGALYLNGEYLHPKDDKGYRALVAVPKLDYSHFTAALDFKADSFDARRSTILFGGQSYRWWGLRWREGALELTLNQGQFRHVFAGSDLRAAEWHNVICSVDLAAGLIRTFLDGRELEDVHLPAGFRLAVMGTEYEQRDRTFTFIDFSNGNTFQGYVKNLRIYGESLSTAQLPGLYRSISQPQPPAPGQNGLVPASTPNPAPAETAQSSPPIAPHSEAGDSASAILAKVATVYRRLTSIHISGKWEEIRSGPRERLLSEAVYELAAQGNDRHFLKIKLNGEEAISASDGQNTWKALASRKQWSRVEAATVAQSGEEQAGRQTKDDLFRFMAGALFSEYPFFARINSNLELVREADYKLTSGRVSCFVIHAQSGKVQEELWVDKERFLVLERTEKVQTPTTLQSIRFKTNSLEIDQPMPESAFRLEPKKNWSEVETVLLPGEQGQTLTGQPAAHFALKTLEGEKLQLGETRGRVVVLDFWATWCPPCRKELPVIEKLRAEFGPNLLVFGINDEDADVVKTFMRKNQYQMTVLMDNARQVQRLYGISAFPTLLIIDKQGIIRNSYVGSRDEATLRSAIRSVVESN